ncbi:DNA-methyltransferase [Streptomyces sp. NBC_01431]|uniref:DNA-methyltransferase n=1 Tax=Streptomyces sp. NBC_01431 TaxID=2903863 RepID=UPI002E33F404|nr:site-specific DNA-methyltransferase [Streptomyces sp. NBC_01431]
MNLPPWYQDDRVALLLGDAATVLATLPKNSVDCVVTSPPYYATRDWGAGQIGQEDTPAAYLDALRTVFHEVHRVLRDDGTCFVNIADVYATGPAARRITVLGQPPVAVKSLLGLPWRLMLALQEDGWLIRNEVVWAKPNAIPESCRDRLARRHEQVFLLTKTGRYHFDLDIIRQPYTGDRALSRRAHHSANKPNTARGTWPPPEARQCNGRNPGTVWTIPTRPTRHLHTAAFPLDLALRCVAAGCPPRAITLDPFSGSGTTLEAALRLGRRAIGIDVRADFHAYAEVRLREVTRTGTCSAEA